MPHIYSELGEGVLFDQGPDGTQGLHPLRSVRQEPSGGEQRRGPKCVRVGSEDGRLHQDHEGTYRRYAYYLPSQFLTTFLTIFFFFNNSSRGG
jgi:hypothetical protein